MSPYEERIPRDSTDDDIREMVLLTSREGGCNCEPDIEIVRGDDAAQVKVSHDGWCLHYSMRQS